MGKLKNIISTRISGNVGAMNFRQRAGEVVVAERVYTNSSKGNGATEAQRVHRSRLANIVNFYRTIIELERKAWANKQAGQSDFNVFSKYNLAGSPIFLTKQEASLGAAVIAPYKVSMGALAPLAGSFVGNVFLSGVAVGASFSIADATIGALADAVIANNSDWKYGDKLSIAIFNGTMRALNELSVPVVTVKYLEITLNAGDSTLLSSLENFAALAPAVTSEGILSISNGDSAAVSVHSREVGSQLLASEQFVVMNPSQLSIYMQYSSEAQKQKAMASYGYKPDVLLTPYSEIDVQVVEPAFVAAVTYDGQPLSDGATITEAGELVISGENLSTANVQVMNGTEVYTPMSQTAQRQTFNISYPGSYRIIVNGNLAYSFTSTIEVTQRVTSVTIGSNSSTTIPWDNLSLRGGQAFNVVVEGSELGELTANGGTIAAAAGDATRRTATLTPADVVSNWSLLCGGVVIAHGPVTA